MQRGPAIHAPLDIKQISVTVCRIEWLISSDPELGFYAKNHMCMILVFDHAVMIGRERYKSARLSIENPSNLGGEVADIVSQEVCNVHGVFLTSIS